MAKTEGLPFPTRQQILDSIGNYGSDAQDLADTLIEMHERGEVLWDGEKMVAVPEKPNS